MTATITAPVDAAEYLAEVLANVDQSLAHIVTVYLDDEHRVITHEVVSKDPEEEDKVGFDPIHGANLLHADGFLLGFTAPQLDEDPDLDPTFDELELAFEVGAASAGVGLEFVDLILFANPRKWTSVRSWVMDAQAHVPHITSGPVLN